MIPSLPKIKRVCWHSVWLCTSVCCSNRSISLKKIWPEFQLKIWARRCLHLISFHVTPRPPHWVEYLNISKRLQKKTKKKQCVRKIVNISNQMGQFVDYHIRKIVQAEHLLQLFRDMENWIGDAENETKQKRCGDVERNVVFVLVVAFKLHDESSHTRPRPLYLSRWLLCLIANLWIY